MGHQRNSDPSATCSVVAEAPLDPDVAQDVATILQGLATSSRVRIVDALRRGPLSVTDLVEALGMEQSAVSHQLRHLRELGFVTSDRQGRHVIYRLFDDHITELVEQGLAHAEHLRLGRPDPS